MKHYRVYCFDGASRIVAADWIEAPDDPAAIQSAKQKYDCFRIAVWDRDRLVGKHQQHQP